MSDKSDSCVNTYFVEGKEIYDFVQVTVADMFVVKDFINKKITPLVVENFTCVFLTHCLQHVFVKLNL